MNALLRRASVGVEACAQAGDAAAPELDELDEVEELQDDEAEELDEESEELLDVLVPESEDDVEAAGLLAESAERLSVL